MTRNGNGVGKAESDTAVTIVALGERTIAQLILIGDDIEAGWKRAAEIYESAKTATGAPSMALYQTIGGYVRQKASAVRSWVGMRKAVGDELLEEFDYLGISHWRLLLRAARDMDKTLADVAVKYAEPGIMVETLAAKLNGTKDEPNPFSRSLERAHGAFMTAIRTSPDEGKRASVQMIANQLEALIENIEAGL